jgi:threonine dehydratase
VAVTRDDVAAARGRIGGRLHRTPVLSSRTLSELVGVPVLLKAELFQRTGSFKPRGVLNVLATLTAQERARGVMGISAGNHAQALAYGAALEGLDCLVVMWRGASEQKIAATRDYGAKVDLAAADPAEAFDRLEALIADSGRVLVHPFDDPRTIAGQGTVGLEVGEDVPELQAVVVPVGGGGLVAGVCAAVSARVIAVEPEGSCALHAALTAGRPVPVEATSIADGLNAPFAGANALAACSGRVDSVLVTDDEIRAAMRFVYERAKLACEPAGAAAVAAVLAGKFDLEPGRPVVAVISGGNVTAKTASAILASE